MAYFSEDTLLEYQTSFTILWLFLHYGMHYSQLMPGFG
jgi:hypothetical protein